MIFYLFWTLLFAGAALCAYRISATDFRRRIIPDAYLFPLILIGLITVTFFPHWVCSVHDGAIGAATGYALGAIIGFIFDWIGHRNGRDSEIPIGMGDIKLLAAGGLWLGTTGLAMALIIACVFGGTWARVRHMRFIPFAPFFVIGAILALIMLAFLI